MTPQEVVLLVVAALRHCNSPIPNAGIFTAYQYASPANHAVTGPYSNFLRLVKSPENAPLLQDYPADMGPMTIHGDHAEEVVTVHVKNGQDEAFRFTLGRYSGRWMVDAVTRTPASPH